MNNYAHNPILPNDTFVPDVEAHVWEDGRIYLYGSFDIQGKRGYCSDKYHVYSSDDLVNWVDHGVSFSASDINWLGEGEVAGALYAPDCAYRNGTYYLYYCIPDGRCGVASSKTPYGPFTDVCQLKGVGGIDPAVLIDDDGQAYLYWGQFDGVRVARLKENMVEIEPESAVQPLSVKEHEFHEGSSVKKINGKYYFLYTDTHRHADEEHPLGMATSLGYAVSDNPMTGFEYKGVVIDNLGCDPKTWNNHGSMECFGGQWYVFYHRSTYGSENSRHVCIEPITIDENGNIPEVRMTSCGAAESIPAIANIPACYACELSGNVRIEGDDTENILVLGQIKPLDSATYRYIGFDGECKFSAKVKADKGCSVEVYIDGKLCATLPVPASEKYEEGSVSLGAVSGKHELTLRFVGDFSSAALDEFTFTKQ